MVGMTFLNFIKGNVDPTMPDKVQSIDGFHVTSEARRRPYLCPSRARNYMQIIGQNYHFEIYISVVEFYLVLETSFYAQQQFKTFRSLQAYNQMVSGFIASVQGHILADKFVVLAKVRLYSIDV